MSGNADTAQSLEEELRASADRRTRADAERWFRENKPIAMQRLVDLYNAVNGFSLDIALELELREREAPITEDELAKYWTGCILGLGRLLRKTGHIYQLEEVARDSKEWAAALSLLRYAGQGDREKLAALVQALWKAEAAFYQNVRDALRNLCDWLIWKTGKVPLRSAAQGHESVAEVPDGTDRKAADHSKRVDQRLRIRLETGEVVLDGRVFQDVDPVAARILRFLWKNRKHGSYISFQRLREAIKFKHDERTLRNHLNSLPEELRCLIVAKPGSGRRIMLPPQPFRNGP